ncbi:MAG: YitT family protein [Oscillospiraceae bacterium]|nr:YitT family protein [Oscillospiraceae bacterium]
MSRKNRSAIVTWVIDIAVIAAAAAVFAVGAVCFITPNDIAPGGATGIAVILHELTGMPLGALILLINIPLIIMGFILLSKKTMIKTLISVAVITVMTDFVFADLPVYKADGGNGMLAAVFGGVLLGAGVGLTYAREATTGGTDIIAKTLNKFFPHMTLGKMQLYADAVVILAGLAVFRNINAALYAVVSIFVQAKVVDMLVYGGQECRFLLVFSENTRQLTERLLQQDRGVTLLNGEGAYSGRACKVIATAVYKSDYAKVKRMIKEIDPAAFVITTGASEVLGEGFQKLA